jgi:hypothetical protein
MKSLLLFKVLIGLPLILLADWILMALLGCTSCLFSVGKDFYCGTYCFIGKGILLLSAGLFIYMILPDLKQHLTYKKNAKAD